MKSRLFAVVCAGATLAFTGAAASAGSLVLGSSGWVASWHKSWDPYLSLAVDGVVGDNVYIEKFVQFTQHSLLIDPVVITFQATSSSAVGNIVILDETVINDSGYAWDGFRMTIQSGSLSGSPIVAFDPVKTNIGGAGGFSINPFTQAEYTFDNKVLTLSHGVVPQGPPPSNVWLPGSISGALWINVNKSAPYSLRAFALKEQPLPVIPLPAAVWSGLSMLGVLAGAGWIRRRRAVIA